MLAPANRLTLLDALRPPAGHAFDSAAAVTYTLDLRALLAAPAAFALASAADGDDATTEPIELLHAIRTHADKITVFAQAGQIAVPPSRRVFAFLERSVVGVTAPGGGIVHPKVWLVRYRSEDGTARHRVLVSSRNLTFDTSWDTLLRLDESRDGTGADLGALRALFEAMLVRAVGSIDAAHRERVEDLAGSLDGIRFGLPAGVDDLELLVLGLSGGPERPLPVQADRSLVISPFLSSDFFGEVLSEGPGMLVSRQESLDGIESAALGRVGSAFVFDDGSTPEIGEAAWDVDDPARPVQGMHAKVFAFEHGERATVFVGSANASGRAFGRNVEVLVELRGSTDELGIDALCGDLEVESDEVELRRLFRRYVRNEEASYELEESFGALETARLQLGAVPVVGHVSEADGEWSVTYRSERPMLLPDDVTAMCWPLTVAGNRRDVVGGERLDHRFDVSLEAISGFLAIEVATETAESRFVVPVELVGLPERRDRELLRLMIGNAERFLRYLLALLADDPADLNLLDAVEQMTGEAGEGDVGRPNSTLPVLESMLRSLRSDPRRLIAVDPLVQDLARTEGGLPPGFADAWEAVIATAREAVS